MIRHFSRLLALQVPRQRHAVCRKINTTQKLLEFRHTESESASYKGSGKTTISFLNDDQQYFLIDSFSAEGFRINQGNSFIHGPMVIFHNAMLCWKVRDVFDINERSLSLFTVLDPCPELVVIGYGDRLKTVTRKATIEAAYEDEEEEERRYQTIAQEEKYNRKVNEHIAKLTLLMRQKGVNVTFLPTEDAAPTYNYLVSGEHALRRTTLDFFLI